MGRGQETSANTLYGTVPARKGQSEPDPTKVVRSRALEDYVTGYYNYLNRLIKVKIPKGSSYAISIVGGRDQLAGMRVPNSWGIK